MKHLMLLSALCTISASPACAQSFSKNPFNDAYRANVKLAETHYEKKEYQLSADHYVKAFAANNGAALLNDRISLAGSWAMAGSKDSAFKELYKLERARYTKYNALRLNDDFKSLHNDKRWAEVTAMVKANRAKYNINLDAALAARLDTVLEEDQEYRMRLPETELRYGAASPEMKELNRIIRHADSVNLIRVLSILDRQGWPSSAVSGDEGSTAIFLVIQHAELNTQETYLPLIRSAATQGQVPLSYLALLEDRIAVSHGKKQSYGTQVGTDAKGRYYLEPLEDPEHVNDRRKEAGLGPLEDYLKEWNIKWPE